MQIALANRDCNSMFFVMGTNIHLTYDSPGPVTLDEAKLLPEHKTTIKNARDRGVLWVTDSNLLDEIPQEVIQPTHTNVVPTKFTTKNLDDVTKSKTEELKKLLKKRIPSIKLEAARLQLSDITTLMTLESSDKCRKSLMAFFNERLEAHANEVSKSVGTEELSDALQAKMVNQVGSTQLTDVVEFEEEEVLLNPNGEDLILAEDTE